MPLSESLELAERPDTDDTEEAVDTERSSCGTAFSASIGEIHGSGESVRSGGGEGADSMAGRGRCGGYAAAGGGRRGSSVCLSAAESAASHLRSPRSAQSGGWVRLLGGDGRRLSRNLSHSKLRRREWPTRRFSQSEAPPRTTDCSYVCTRYVHGTDACERQAACRSVQTPAVQTHAARIRF